MGFNNDGLDKILKRIKSYKGNLVIGANIGKNKNTPNDEAINDYLICFKKLRNYVDYFVINVSSPNTPQLRELQSKSNLSSLLKIIQKENSLAKIVPVLVKIAPDLSKKEIDDIIKVCIKNKIDGVVATNTTTSRNKLINDNFLVNKIGKGGLSGKPIKTKSDEMINYIRKISKDKIKIIGVGGVFNYGDFKDKIDSGADLVQIYTGWIYEGPFMVKRIIKSHLKLEN